MNDNLKNQPADFETPIYPGHDTSMDCMEQMIDFTPDIESEYALLMTRDLFRAAPDLLHVVKYAFQELDKLRHEIPALATISERLNDALGKAMPPRPLTA